MPVRILEQRIGIKDDSKSGRCWYWKGRQRGNGHTDRGERVVVSERRFEGISKGSSYSNEQYVNNSLEAENSENRRLPMI
jgi:hypothetical protein